MNQQNNRIKHDALPLPFAHADDEIDLLELLVVLWKGRWWIILVTLLCTSIAVGMALGLPNIYRAETTLAPSSEQEGKGLGALAGQFSGLASLAGINMGGGGIDKVGIAIEVAKSRQFVTTFIHKHQLEIPLIAVKGINKQNGHLDIDAKIYDSGRQQWVRNVKPPQKQIPSDWELYKEFMKIFSIEQDKKTSLINVGVDFYSPELAKQWVDWLVEDINATMKARDQADTKRNIEYLKQQLEKTPVADMQAVFYKLIEEQTKTLMLAEVNLEYVFKTLDPAVVPEEKVQPRRSLIVMFGGFSGCMLGVLFVLIRYALRKR